MQRIIEAATFRYPVVINAGSVRRFTFPDDAVVIYDRAIERIVCGLFPQHRRLPVHISEQRKRLATVESICERLVQLGCDRSTSLIAVGGGVLGDVVGFVASVYMRGIRYYHVPTTLVAMVDSSIGGKTGVDLASGKNLVGTIYQPQAVIIDPSFLTTLSAAQFSNGMAEVVKHGVLFAPLFRWLERHRAAIQRRHLPTLEQMIAKNVEVKAAIVEKDEYERDERMLLNIGHTFGHAIEKVSHYRTPHGQAVAYGLAYASAYSTMAERPRLLRLLHEFGLATEMARPYRPKQLVQVMLADKKHRGDTLTLVLPMALGQVTIFRRISPKAVEQFLCRYHDKPSHR